MNREWRCYHCDSVFTDAVLAAEHFGDDRNNPRPASCQGMLNAIYGEFERYGVHRNFHNAASVKILANKIKQECESRTEQERDAIAYARSVEANGDRIMLDLLSERLGICIRSAIKNLFLDELTKRAEADTVSRRQGGVA